MLKTGAFPATAPGKKIFRNYENGLAVVFMNQPHEILINTARVDHCWCNKEQSSASASLKRNNPLVLKTTV